MSERINARLSQPLAEFVKMGGLPGNSSLTPFCLPTTKTMAGNRLKQYATCKDRFKALVELIDPSTVPAKAGAAYKLWTK